MLKRERDCAPDEEGQSAFFRMKKRPQVNRHDFLVEIGTEELPPKSLLALAEAFRDGIAAGLEAAHLSHGAAHA